MTRHEFDEIISWGALKDFCYDYDCEYCDEIYDEYDRDYEIKEDLSQQIREYSWDSIRDMLNDIPNGNEYYRKNSAFDWECADDLFEEYKSDVFGWACDNDIFDEDIVDEDDTVEDEDDIVEGEDILLEEEDFSVDDLIGMCSISFYAIQEDKMRKIQDDNAAFEQFIDINIPKNLT